jgi:hypothetical protein
MNLNIQSILGVDDRRCTATAEVEEEYRLRLLLQHLNLSPYSRDTNFWRAPPLASNHLSPSTTCLAQFIDLVSRWLHEGVLVGERGCSAEQGGASISLVAAGHMIHRLWTWTTPIIAPEAVVGWLLGSVSAGTQADRCGRPYPITV